MQANGYWNNVLLVGSLRFPVAFAEFTPLLWKQKTKQKPKKKRNRGFTKPLCSSFSFFSSLGDTRDYISLQLIYCCCRSIRHFIQDRQGCKKLISRSSGSWYRKLSCKLILPQETTCYLDSSFTCVSLLPFLWLNHQRRKNGKRHNHKRIS